AFAPTRTFWMLMRTGDRWEVILQDETDARSSNELERLAARMLGGDRLSDDRDAAGLPETCFPMLAAGAVVGVLGVGGDPVTEDQRSVFGAAAAVIAIGVKNMQLFVD